jgi:hypothetical protein
MCKMEFMRLFARAICWVAMMLVARSSAAAEPLLALGPVAYAGEIPDYFQREIDQTVLHALQSGHATIFELPVDSCQRIDCLLEPAREAKSAAVILVRVSKRDRDYGVELIAYDVDDGAVIAEVTGECSVCGQQELLDMLPAELGKLLNRWEAAAGDEEVVQQAPEPVPTGRTKGTGVRVGGWLATSLGVGGIGAGVALLVLDGRPHQPTCSPELVDVNGACPNVYTTSGAGYTLLGVGIAALGAGIGLLVHGYRQRDRTARVQFAPGYLHIRF